MGVTLEPHPTPPLSAATADTQDCAPPLLQLSSLAGGQPEAGSGWELGVINLNVLFFFFPLDDRVLCFCIEWWGGPGGEF